MVGQKPEYLVKWNDYSSDENTWEPESNLRGCKEMIVEFEKKMAKMGKSSTVQVAKKSTKQKVQSRDDKIKKKSARSQQNYDNDSEDEDEE